MQSSLGYVQVDNFNINNIKNMGIRLLSQTPNQILFLISMICRNKSLLSIVSISVDNKLIHITLVKSHFKFQQNNAHRHHFFNYFTFCMRYYIKAFCWPIKRYLYEISLTHINYKIIIILCCEIIYILSINQRFIF